MLLQARRMRSFHLCPERSRRSTHRRPVTFPVSGSHRYRLLVLTPAFPYPPVSGGDIRMFHLLRGLAQQFEIHLLSYSGGDSDRLIQETGIAAAHIHRATDNPTSWWQPMKGIGFWRYAPHGISLDVDPSYANTLKRTLASTQFHGVLIDHLYMMQYARFVRPRPVFYTAPDVETVKFERWHQGETLAPKRRFLHWAQRRVIRWYESRLWRRARVTFAASTVDRDLLVQMNRKGRFIVAPNGVDLSYFRPRSRSSFEGPPAIFFVGTMSYKPNYHAARFLAQEVFPRIRHHFPAAVCHLAGKTGKHDYAELNHPELGVRMHGFVDDIRPFFAQCQILLVPLAMGSGTRIKILEGMASGTPIVSTRVGAEGLEYTDGQNIVIADSAVDLAAAAVRLLESREECYRLGMAGRRLVEKQYSWDSSANIVRNEISDILKEDAVRLAGC